MAEQNLEPVVSRATTDDLPQLVELLKFLFQQEAEFQPNQEAQTEGLRSILTSPEIGDILVLRDDGQLLGMVNLLYTVSTALGARVVLLEDMVVRPEYRQRGLGSRLLTAAVAHARSVGCRRITLLTDGNNVDARRFYENLGFQHSTMIPLRRQL